MKDMMDCTEIRWRGYRGRGPSRQARRGTSRGRAGTTPAAGTLAPARAAAALRRCIQGREREGEQYIADLVEGGYEF